MTQEGPTPSSPSPAPAGPGAPSPAAPPPPAPPSGPAGTMSKDERMWGMLCHIAAFAGYVVPGIGFILGPLVIWLMKKEQYPFVDQQGKEALNWQITIFIGVVISGILTFFCIGAPMLAALGLIDLIYVILAAVKANDGIAFKYPWRIQFFK
jgi:uncharacterized protein